MGDRVQQLKESSPETSNEWDWWLGHARWPLTIAVDVATGVTGREDDMRACLAFERLPSWEEGGRWLRKREPSLRPTNADLYDKAENALRGRQAWWIAQPTRLRSPYGSGQRRMIEWVNPALFVLWVCSILGEQVPDRLRTWAEGEIRRRLVDASERGDRSAVLILRKALCAAGIADGSAGGACAVSHGLPSTEHQAKAEVAPPPTVASKGASLPRPEKVYHVFTNNTEDPINASEEGLKEWRARARDYQVYYWISKRGVVHDAGGMRRGKRGTPLRLPQKAQQALRTLLDHRGETLTPDAFSGDRREANRVTAALPRLVEKPKNARWRITTKPYLVALPASLP